MGHPCHSGERLLQQLVHVSDAGVSGCEGLTVKVLTLKILECLPRGALTLPLGYLQRGKEVYKESCSKSFCFISNYGYYQGSCSI
jgi:hypothetical protein